MATLAYPTPFLSVCHSFFLQECGDVSPEQYQEVTQFLTRFVIDRDIPHTELTSKIADILGHSVEFPNRIHDILTVPEDPPSGHGLGLLSQDGTRRQNPWSKVEDNRLLCAIHKFGIQNWSAVANFVGYGRSRAQCSQRWNRGLNPDLRKLSWTADEEGRLRELVARHGVKAWTKVAHEMGTRSDIQCRYHFLQIQRNRRNDHSKRVTPKLEIPVGEPQIDLQKAQTSSTCDLFAENESGQLLSQDDGDPFNPFF
jgi:hypothetical protein